MPTTVDVPLTIQPDAAALVAEWRLQKELEMMLEQVRRVVPNLRRLVVSYAEPYDTGVDDVALIEAFWIPEGQQPEAELEIYRHYNQWEFATFKPEVYRHFTFLLWDERNHAR